MNGRWQCWPVQSDFWNLGHQRSASWHAARQLWWASGRCSQARSGSRSRFSRLATLCNSNRFHRPHRPRSWWTIKSLSQMRLSNRTYCNEFSAAPRDLIIQAGPADCADGQKRWRRQGFKLVALRLVRFGNHRGSWPDYGRGRSSGAWRRRVLLAEDELAFRTLGRPLVRDALCNERSSRPGGSGRDDGAAARREFVMAHTCGIVCSTGTSSSRQTSTKGPWRGWQRRVRSCRLGKIGSRAIRRPVRSYRPRH
jgi:hypothetical protein